MSNINLDFSWILNFTHAYRVALVCFCLFFSFFLFQNDLFIRLLYILEFSLRPIGCMKCCRNTHKNVNEFRWLNYVEITHPKNVNCMHSPIQNWVQFKNAKNRKNGCNCLNNNNIIDRITFELTHSKHNRKIKCFC